MQLYLNMVMCLGLAFCNAAQRQWPGLSTPKHLTQPSDLFLWVMFTGKVLSMPDWWAVQGHTMTSTRIVRRPAPVRENVDDIAFPTREDIKRKHGHQLTPKFRFRQQMGVKETSHDFARTAFIVEPPRKSISFQLPRITTITYPTVTHTHYMM